MILRVISDNRLEEGHHDDRHPQYRPCPPASRNSSPRRPRTCCASCSARSSTRCSRPRPMRSAARSTARPARSGPTVATATGTATSTPAPAPSTSRSPSCAKAPTSRVAARAAQARRTGTHLGGRDLLPARGLHPADGQARRLAWASPRCPRRQVSEMAKELDAHVEEFRTRRLEDAGPFTFVAADALVLKVREGGRVVPVHALVATGVNADGHREILGIQVTTSEDGAGWLAFFRDLTARGLSGVKLVTSDAHAGLTAAIAATLPGASLAAVPHPLRREPDVGDPEELLGLGQGAAALDLRPARHRSGARPVRPGRRRPGREAPHRGRPPRASPRRHPRVHRVPQGDLAPDLVQQPHIC